MIFGELKLEGTLQVNDKTRLDAIASYLTPDEAAITLLEIEPHTGDGFIDVTTPKYMDYSYSTAGAKIVTVRITTDGAPQSFTKGISVISSIDDALFSTDEDIVPLEDDILKYVRNGRNSFLDKHREAQKIVLNDLDKAKIWKNDGAIYTASDIVDIQEFKEQSKYLTLHLIFKSLSNAIDDIFSSKAAKYKSFATDAGNRGSIHLDGDADGDLANNAKTDIFSATLRRR